MNAAGIRDGCGCAGEGLTGSERSDAEGGVRDLVIPMVECVVSFGDEVEVKCIGVDPQGKIKLSRKQLLLQG